MFLKNIVAFEELSPLLQSEDSVIHPSTLISTLWGHGHYNIIT